MTTPRHRSPISTTFDMTSLIRRLAPRRPLYAAFWTRTMPQPTDYKQLRFHAPLPPFPQFFCGFSPRKSRPRVGFHRAMSTVHPRRVRCPCCHGQHSGRRTFVLGGQDKLPCRLLLRDDDLADRLRLGLGLAHKVHSRSQRPHIVCPRHEVHYLAAVGGEQ